MGALLRGLQRLRGLQLEQLRLRQEVARAPQKALGVKMTPWESSRILPGGQGGLLLLSVYAEKREVQAMWGRRLGVRVKGCREGARAALAGIAVCSPVWGAGSAAGRQWEAKGDAAHLCLVLLVVLKSLCRCYSLCCCRCCYFRALF